jgi:hypothetical protein
VSGAAEKNSNLFAEVSAVDARIEHPLHRRAMPRLRTLASRSGRRRSRCLTRSLFLNWRRLVE